MQVQAYINFFGRCEEALAFYGKVLGATTQFVMRYSESPEAGNTPAELQNKIMHVAFTIGESSLMACDAMHGEQPTGHKISLTLLPKSVEEGQKLFEGLSEGGQVVVPYGPTFWARGFAIVVDAFDVQWMINFE